MPWRKRPASERGYGVNETMPWVWIDQSLINYYKRYLNGDIQIEGLTAEFNFSATNSKAGIVARVPVKGPFERRESIKHPTVKHITRPKANQLELF